MSKPLYNTGGLRFWSQEEIRTRTRMKETLVDAVQETLQKVNPAWRFFECEAPILTPKNVLNPEYDGDDVWLLEAPIGDQVAALRPETTPGSYAYARYLLENKVKPPLCVYQAGKSFRRETSDGASPSKLRFNEFWQLEFQCIYSRETKADYRRPIESELCWRMAYLTGQKCRLVESDRLPSYSILTNDLEVWHPSRDEPREMASISTRVDFSEQHYVLEIAVGLDRMVEIYNEGR